MTICITAIINSRARLEYMRSGHTPRQVVITPEEWMMLGQEIAIAQHRWESIPITYGISILQMYTEVGPVNIVVVDVYKEMEEAFGFAK